MVNSNTSKRNTLSSLWLTGLSCSLAILLMLPVRHAGADTKAEFHLHVRPSICVSYDSSAPCAMSMLVTWDSSGIADVCLKEANQDALLHCWRNSSQGKVQLDYADSRDVKYWLVDESSHGVLAEAEVVIINRDLRDSRKRRRHVWSIL